MKRHITLMIENASFDEIVELKRYCNKYDLDFEYRYGKEWKGTSFLTYYGEGIAPLYYFTIFGDTSDYEKLNNDFNKRIILTDYAEIGNVANLDDSFEKEFKALIETLRASLWNTLDADRKLLDFLKPIKDVKLLKEIKKYSCHMSEKQRRMLEDRILIISNEREKVDEEFKEDMLSLHVDIKALREATSMNRKEFANYFEIPYRTVEDWENKKSTCSTYLYKLMLKDLKNNNLLKREV